MEEKNNKNHRLKTFYAISLAWQLGFLIIFSLGGFLILGFLLDRLFNTNPLFLMVGLLVGLVITFYEVYFLLKPLIEKENND